MIRISMPGRSILPAMLTALTVVALGACVAPQPAPAPIPAPATVLPPATAAAIAAPSASAAPAAAATTPATTVSPAGATLPAGSPTVAAGRGSLTSYTAQIEYKEEVVKPAPVVVQTWVVETMIYDGDPAPGAYQLDVTDKIGATAPAGSGNMKVIVTGQDSYVLTPDQGGKWLKLPIDQNGAVAGPGDLLDPNKLVLDAPAGLFSAANVVNAHEQVAGEDTTHYRAKDALLAGLLAKEMEGSKLVGGQADFWLSNRTGAIKQYQLDVTVQTGDGRQLHELGKLSVSDENKPVAIATPAPDQVISMDLFNQPAQAAPGSTALPSGALQSAAGTQAMKAVPAPPSGKAATTTQLAAAVRTALQDYTVAGLPSALYVSTAKAVDIVAFYRTQLTKQGWQEVDSQSGATVAQPTKATFTMGDLTLDMVILPDTAKTGNAVFIQVEG